MVEEGRWSGEAEVTTGVREVGKVNSTASQSCQRAHDNVFFREY